MIGGGNVYPMTAGNTQFVINGVQYTITLKAGSLNGATISGQFNITQGNVVVIENYVYQIDTLNGQIVGNGTAYPLTTSGVTYTITTTDRSFTVTTEPNATTVTIGNIVYQINNTTVVGDGVVYPILVYRTFVDGATSSTSGSTAPCRSRRRSRCRARAVHALDLHRRRGPTPSTTSPRSTGRTTSG